MNNEDQGFLIPEDHELDFVQLVCDLAARNHSRYEKQAQQLIRNGEISITLNDSLLLYTLEDGGCSFRISKDGGFDFHKLQWTNLRRRKCEKLKMLIWKFANSEASTILNL